MSELIMGVQPSVNTSGLGYGETGLTTRDRRSNLYFIARYIAQNERMSRSSAQTDSKMCSSPRNLYIAQLHAQSMALL